MKKTFSREEINKKIGINIRYIRKNNHLSQEKFAEKLDLSPQFVSDVERGVEGISLATVINICNTMKCSPLVIFSNLIDYENYNSTQNKTYSHQQNYGYCFHDSLFTHIFTFL